MVQEDKYCIDVIKQTLAIQRALDVVNTLMLGNHFSTCVTTAIRSQDPAEREWVISELLDVFDAAAKL